MSMERCFRIPLDVESRPWFRELVSLFAVECGYEREAARARSLVELIELFRELGYAAESNPLGFLPMSQGLNVKLLEKCGLLKDIPGEAGSKGCQCDVFVRLNPELDSEFVPEARKGGFARAAKIQLRNAAREALSEELDVQGLFAGMESPQVVAAMGLVKATDNVYARRARKPMEWTEGLVADAKRVREKFADEAIEAVLAKILQRRKDAKLDPRWPQATEDLLRNFENYV